MNSTRKVLIIGASGFVGSKLMESLPHNGCIGTFFTRPLSNCVPFDISSERLADRFLLSGHRFTHAVLAQGVTKLAQCALDTELSTSVNVLGTIRAIDDLLDAGVRPIFLSSDAVFDGSKGPHSEHDTPCPIVSYGRQKLAIERYLQVKSSDHTILRLCKVVANFSDSRNILSVWLNQIGAGTPILCATDQILTPISVEDAVRTISFFVTTGVTGLYHVASSPPVTRYELLMELIKFLPDEYRRRAIVTPCRLREIPSPEPLPVDCSLENCKLKSLVGFEFASMTATCQELAGSVFSESPIHTSTFTNSAVAV